MSLPRPQDQIDVKWAEKAQELEFGALERVKTAAEKWLTTIASLTGVLGLSAFIKGPDEINKLTPLNQLVVGIALLAALLCAFFAIYFGALAAQGIPSKIWNTGPTLRREVTRAADAAVRHLNLSRMLVIPVLLFLTLSVGLIWFGTKTATPESNVKVLVVPVSGAVRCGELTADDQGNLIVKAKDGMLISLDEIKSMGTIAECP